MPPIKRRGDIQNSWPEEVISVQAQAVEPYPASRVWSLYGAPWLQPVAIAGKSAAPRNRKNKRNPLRLAATGYGKEGVSGSSPEEGLKLSPA